MRESLHLKMRGQSYATTFLLVGGATMFAPLTPHLVKPQSFSKQMKQETKKWFCFCIWLHGVLVVMVIEASYHHANKQSR